VSTEACRPVTIYILSGGKEMEKEEILAKLQRAIEGTDSDLAEEAAKEAVL